MAKASRKSAVSYRRLVPSKTKTDQTAAAPASSRPGGDYRGLRAEMTDCGGDNAALDTHFFQRSVGRGINRRELVYIGQSGAPFVGRREHELNVAGALCGDGKKIAICDLLQGGRCRDYGRYLVVDA
jgi:hypothetical protein